MPPSKRSTIPNLIIPQTRHIIHLSSHSKPQSTQPSTQPPCPLPQLATQPNTRPPTWSFFTIPNSKSRRKQHRRTRGLTSPTPSIASDNSSRDADTCSDGAKCEAGAAVAGYHHGGAAGLAYTVGGGTCGGESDEAREGEEKFFGVEVHGWKSCAAGLTLVGSVSRLQVR